MKIEEDRNRVVDPHDWNIDACENLANKIIENACNDFRAAYADTFPRDSSKNSTCVALYHTKNYQGTITKPSRTRQKR